MNGVVSFIKPPLSLLLNYPPFNLKLIEYYYPSISNWWFFKESNIEEGGEVIN